MTSGTGDGKPDHKRPIGGRATEAQIKLIDLAAAIRQTDRGNFLVEAGYREAIGVLEKSAPQLLNLKTA